MAIGHSFCVVIVYKMCMLFVSVHFSRGSMLGGPVFWLLLISIGTAVSDMYIMLHSILLHSRGCSI